MTTNNKCLSKLSAGWVALLLTYLLEECPLADTSVPRSSLLWQNVLLSFYNASHPSTFILLSNFMAPTEVSLKSAGRMISFYFVWHCRLLPYPNSQSVNKSYWPDIWLRNHGHMAVIGYGKYLILPFFGTIGQYIRFIWSRLTTSRQNMNRALQTRLIRYLPYPISAKWP